MLELIVGILLAAGATYYVLHPILRPAPQVPRKQTEALMDEGDDPDDDWSPQTVALRALKEIEFDRATGKLADADYEALKAKYTGEALAAMRGEAPGSAVRGARESSARSPRTAHRAQCPEHGPRPEPDAIFCSDCGRRLGTAPAYCPRCGTELEKGARYCERCGARAAA
jgi:hypothetical protein